MNIRPQPPDHSHVTLQPLTRAWAKPLFDALQDPEIGRYTGDPPPKDYERWLRRAVRLENTLADDGIERWLNWIVLENEACAGYVQATVHVPLENGGCAADIAYVLNPNFVGRRVAERASRLMIELLTREYNVRELWVTIHRDNARSIALAQRLGLRQEDPSRYPYDNYDPEIDVVLRATL